MYCSPLKRSVLVLLGWELQNSTSSSKFGSRQCSLWWTRSYRTLTALAPHPSSLSSTCCSSNRKWSVLLPEAPAVALTAALLSSSLSLFPQARNSWKLDTDKSLGCCCQRSLLPAKRACECFFLPAPNSILIAEVTNYCGIPVPAKRERECFFRPAPNPISSHKT